jgi:hypothetical protein
METRDHQKERNMKIQKMLLLVAVLGLVALMSTSVFAAPANFTGVTVIEAGDVAMDATSFKKITPSIQFLLQLTADPASQVYAYAVKGQENRMLAVALTAMANGSKVNITADLSPSKGARTVYKMNLVAAQ